MAELPNLPSRGFHIFLSYTPVKENIVYCNRQAKRILKQQVSSSEETTLLVAEIKFSLADVFLRNLIIRNITPLGI